MGTPSDAYREYLGILTPEQQALAEAETAQKRQVALAKARATRSAAAADRAAKMATETRHIHPADDRYARACRTLCGKVVNVQFALAPTASTLRGETWKRNGCAKCAELLSGWWVEGNSKPLTIRRLRTRQEEQRMKNETVAGEAVVRGLPGLVFNPEKGRRESALESALVVLTGREDIVDGKVVRIPPPKSVQRMEPSKREAAVDMLIGLIGLETARREGRQSFADREDASGAEKEGLVTRAWHLELVRLGLPMEVLRALRGL